jgi:hypothetical protein
VAAVPIASQKKKTVGRVDDETELVTYMKERRCKCNALSLKEI